MIAALCVTVLVSVKFKVLAEIEGKDKALVAVNDTVDNGVIEPSAPPKLRVPALAVKL